MRTFFPVNFEIMLLFLSPAYIWMWERNIALGDLDPTSLATYLWILTATIGYMAGNLALAADPVLRLGDPRWWGLIDLTAGLLLPYMLYYRGIEVYKMREDLTLAQELSGPSPIYAQILYQGFCIMRSYRTLKICHGMVKRILL